MQGPDAEHKMLDKLQSWFEEKGACFDGRDCLSLLPSCPALNICTAVFCCRRGVAGGVECRDQAARLWQDHWRCGRGERGDMAAWGGCRALGANWAQLLCRFLGMCTIIACLFARAYYAGQQTLRIAVSGGGGGGGGLLRKRGRED